VDLVAAGVVDGAVGAEFMGALKKIVENPLELLLREREYQTYMGNLGGESAGREYQTYVGNLSGSGGCPYRQRYVGR
jgi:hypothetical protein